MSQASKLSVNLGSLSVQNLIPAKITYAKPSVTQVTSITTACTINNAAGAIRTVSSTLATQGSAKFTVSNSFVKPDSLVMANIIGYTGTQGSPSTIITTVTTGSFAVTVRNLDLTNPLSGAVTVGFQIL